MNTCPDCPNKPGKYIGFSGVLEDCKTCNGTAEIGDSSSVGNKVCPSWVDTYSDSAVPYIHHKHGAAYSIENDVVACRSTGMHNLWAPINLKKIDKSVQNSIVFALAVFLYPEGVSLTEWKHLYKDDSQRMLDRLVEVGLVQI